MSILIQIVTIRGKNCKCLQICLEKNPDNLTSKQNVSIKVWLSQRKENTTAKVKTYR